MNGIREEELKTRLIRGLETILPCDNQEAKQILATSTSTWKTITHLFDLIKSYADEEPLQHINGFTNIRQVYLYENQFKRTYRDQFARIYRDRCIALMFAGRGGAAGATKDVMRIIARVVYSMRDL